MENESKLRLVKIIEEALEKFIMKNIYGKLSIFFLVLFFSCEKEEQRKVVTCTQPNDYAYLENYARGSLCTNDLCKNYQVIWKELLMENNNITDNYFNANIEVVSSNIQNWNDGSSFNICYKVNLGWAIAYNCDQFIIKMAKANTLYPHLIIPRDTYLTKENIKTVVSNRAFSSKIIKLSNTETLKFSSMKEALNTLIEAANVNTLCSGRIFIHKSTGNLILEAGAEYDYKNNKCLQGTIDLITGETSVSDTPCYIN